MTTTMLPPTIQKLALHPLRLIPVMVMSLLSASAFAHKPNAALRRELRRYKTSIAQTRTLDPLDEWLYGIDKNPCLETVGKVEFLTSHLRQLQNDLDRSRFLNLNRRFTVQRDIDQTNLELAGIQIQQEMCNVANAYRLNEQRREDLRKDSHENRLNKRRVVEIFKKDTILYRSGRVYSSQYQRLKGQYLRLRQTLLKSKAADAEAAAIDFIANWLDASAQSRVITQRQQNPLLDNGIILNFYVMVLERYKRRILADGYDAVEGSSLQSRPLPTLEFLDNYSLNADGDIFTMTWHFEITDLMNAFRRRLRERFRSKSAGSDARQNAIAGFIQTEIDDAKRRYQDNLEDSRRAHQESMRMMDQLDELEKASEQWRHQDMAAIDQLLNIASGGMEPPLPAAYDGTLHRSGPWTVNGLTANHNNRYSRPNTASLETTADEITSGLDSQALAPPAGFRRVHLERVLDLTDPYVREQLHVGIAQLLRDDYLITQAIGVFAKALGYQAIRAPNIGAGSSTQVILLDPEWETDLMTLEDFLYSERQRYSVVEIFTKELSHPDGSPRPTSPGILSILKYLEEWILNEFDRRGTARRGTERFEAFKKKARLDDGRSSFIFVSEDNNLRNIKALLRVARIGDRPENQLLPLEDHLQIVLPRPPLELKTVDGRPRLYGDIVELKNFVRAEDAELDFIPYLFHKARESGLFDTTFRTADYEGHTYDLYPSLFYLYCDTKTTEENPVSMADKYGKLGFKLVQTFPGQDIAVMAIDRDGLQNIESLYGRRSGGALISHRTTFPHLTPWTPLTIPTFEAAQSHSNPIPFFEEAMPSQSPTASSIFRGDDDDYILDPTDVTFCEGALMPYGITWH